MNLQLSNIWYAIRSNFWFLPALLSLAGIASALLLLEADIALHNSGYLARLAMPTESARLALSTIAGSMITMASLVFSMTLVALTLVSQQLGPRILVRFMDDRPTQIVLGLFIATFLFSLIMLIRSGGDDAEGGRVPGVAVAVTATIAVLSLGAMIHFIHHIATRIQADVLVAELGEDLNFAAAQFIEAGTGEEPFATDGEREHLDQLFDRSEPKKISLKESGYLRRPDAATACRLAEENDLVLRMTVRPGTFALAGVPLMEVAARGGGTAGGTAKPNASDENASPANALKDELTDKLRATMTVSRRRTPQASVEFEIDALVEVALRALSPGINDVYTAMTCIDRLSVGVRTLMQRDGDQRVARGSDGEIRFAHAAEPFGRYLNKAFRPIRHAGRDNPMLLDKLEEALCRLREAARTPQQRETIEELLGQVRATSPAGT